MTKKNSGAQAGAESPAGYDYRIAKSLRDAAQLLAAEPGARIVAGGTDLLLDIREGRRRPALLVDISRLAELKSVFCDEAGFFLGAGLTFSELTEEPLVRKYFAALAEAAARVGSPQIRNRGTLGGNLATGSAAGDAVCPVTAFDGRLALVRAPASDGDSAEARGKGDNVIPSAAAAEGLELWSVSLEEFWKPGVRNELGSRSLLAGVCFPYPKNRRRSVFVKLGRRESLAISRLNLTMAVEEDDRGMIAWARVAVGSAGVHPYRVAAAEEALLGKALEEVSLDRLQEELSEKIRAVLGSRSTAGYKSKAIRGMAEEGLRRLLGAASR